MAWLTWEEVEGADGSLVQRPFVRVARSTVVGRREEVAKGPGEVDESAAAAAAG